MSNSKVDNTNIMTIEQYSLWKKKKSTFQEKKMVDNYQQN